MWILVLFVIGRGLSKGVEAANKIFLPLLVILFLALVVRALFLPGAVEGLNAFFTPNWGALVDPQGVAGRLRADLLLAVRGLWHHADLRFLPPSASRT